MNSDPFYTLDTVREAIHRGDAEYVRQASDGYDASDTAAFFGEWRRSAYTAESAEIQALLRAHVESPNSPLWTRLLAWLKRVLRP